MRAAYVCVDKGVPIFGCKGSSIHVQAILQSFHRAGVTADVFASRIERGSQALAGVRIQAIPRVRGNNPAERERDTEAADRWLFNALEQAGPFDFVYERYSLWTSAAMEFAIHARIPGLLEVNAPLIDEQAAYRELDNHEMAERLSRQALSCASAILAVSREVAEYAARMRRTRDGIHVITNAVDPERFPQDVKPSRPAPHLFTIGFLGSLKPWHALSVVVDALEILVNRDCWVRLLIVGDGPQRAEIEDAVAEKRLAAQCEFVGAVDPATVPSLLASMNVAVVPYPPTGADYFSPLKLFECMAAGLPVVASRVGQVAEIVEDNVTALLVQPGSAQAMADAFERLRTDVALRARLGAAARDHVIKNHTWDRVASQILDVATSRAGRTMETAR